MPRVRAKPKIVSSKLSQTNLRNDAKFVNQTHNRLWACTRVAPLFLRRPKMVGVGKNKRRATYVNKRGENVPIAQTSNRCVRRFPLRVLLSAATANAASILRNEAALMRVAVKGEVVSGALPQISKGGEIALENALIAYAQTAFQFALDIKDSIKMHKKVTAGAMSAATKILNSQLTASTSLAPGMYFLDRKPSVKRKAKKSAVAPGDDVVDTAVDTAE